MKRYFLDFISVGIYGVGVCLLLPVNALALNLNDANSTVSAFVRVKNEIKTIEASLNSIKNVFDKIVIIHSNEPDDGTVNVARQWCAKVAGCEIHEYPYAVIPSHHSDYQKKVKPENTLAAYYNFGLDFFKPDEWVVKIDADQIYITERLQQSLNYIRSIAPSDDKVAFGIRGYNTFPYKGRLVKLKARRINGGFDSFIVKRKYMNKFKQTQWYEKHVVSQDIQKTRILPGLHWFHYMKTLKSRGQIRENDSVPENEVISLSYQEVQLYRQDILPLLEQSNSPYQSLILE